MKIGIDIDDTLLGTHEEVVKHANMHAKHLDFSNYEHFETEEEINFFREHIEVMQINAKPLPGSIEALNVLKEKGYELIFITARGSSYEFNMEYDYKKVTEAVFEKYKIPYDKIIYKCFPKGEMAKLLEIDIFLDDREDNLDDVAKHGIKCIKVVPNMDIESKYIKFDNWDDILNYILNSSK